MLKPSNRPRYWQTHLKSTECQQLTKRCFSFGSSFILFLVNITLITRVAGKSPAWDARDQPEKNAVPKPGACFCCVYRMII